MNYHKLHESWNKFLKEEDLTEATDEEMEHISDILHDLNYDDLPFGNMFGETTRLIQPMKTKDKELEKLKNLLEDSGYAPDFATGKASYYTVTFPPTKEGEKHLTMILTPPALDGIMKKQSRDTEEGYQKRIKRVRKREIGIGKLLQKGSRLFDGAQKTQEEFEAVGPTDYPRDEYDKYRRKSMELEDKADKDYKKLADVFTNALPIGGKDVNRYKELAHWWNKKSTFYRENPEAAKEGAISGKYSIVYSRHPIDVLRRSDFDAIESCHSPPSRSEGSAEYWRCAVAEAHGHGAIAYIVKDEDLKDVKEKYELEDATDQEFLDALDTNDEELFYDDKREEESGDIEPVSRVMIRQYGQPELGIRLAVPEQRIYGDKNPAFHKQVSAWAKENQKEEIDKITNSPDVFDEQGYLNLRKWERYGGSYQDTYDPEMFHGFLGFKTDGRATHDSATEDSLEVHGNRIQEWQAEVDNIAHRANNNYYSSHINGFAQDDGGDGVYIEIRAHFTIKIDEEEFLHSAFQEQTRRSLEGVADNLREMGYDWLEDRVDYTVVRGEVVIDIPVLIEKIDPEGSAYAYDPENFQLIANALDQRDNMTDEINAITKSYLKREGVIKGAALIQLARALEDESWYEWDYDVDDDWDPTSIALSTKQYVNLDDLIQKMPVKLERGGAQATEGIKILFDGNEIARAYQTHDGEGNFKWWEIVSEEFENKKLGGFKNAEEIEGYARHEIAKMIVGPTLPGSSTSRNYSVAVRILFRDAIGGVEGEFKYPYTTLESGGMDSDDEWRLSFTMNLDDDDPDDVVENAHKVISELDDEDEIKDIFRRAFAKVAGINVTPTSIKEVKKYFSKYSFLLD